MSTEFSGPASDLWAGRPAETRGDDTARAESEPGGGGDFDLTTVSTTHAVFHRQGQAFRLDGLEPGTRYQARGHDFETLARPGGQLLCRVATVNDLHLGETECGRHSALDIGPVLRTEPGDVPYPTLMARAAAAEMAAIAPDAVVAKGDLTDAGAPGDLAAFLDAMAPVSHRLHWMAGNHDRAPGGRVEGPHVCEVALEGVTLALVDTSVDALAGGRLDGHQLDWLDELGARADRPVLIMGHHQPWDPNECGPEVPYSGMDQTSSIALAEGFGRRDRLVAYLCGHTHRNRVRRLESAGGAAWIEVGSTKDFPGGWAEYQVYEGGILQIFHRTSDPAALAWSERTRGMFAGMFGAYSFGSLSDRCLSLNRTA
ncbi:MAG: metallophosphoesterase [Acidimicrobiales bacterium]